MYRKILIFILIFIFAGCSANEKYINNETDISFNSTLTTTNSETSNLEQDYNLEDDDSDNSKNNLEDDDSDNSENNLEDGAEEKIPIPNYSHATLTKATCKETDWEQYYKTDDYDKYNTPRSENGLAGTLLQISGTIDSVISSEDYFYILTDENDKKWVFVTVQNLSELHLESGSKVNIYGYYEGNSTHFSSLPTIFLKRMKYDDNIYTEVVYSLDYANNTRYEVVLAEEYEGRSFEDIHAQTESVYGLSPHAFYYLNPAEGHVRHCSSRNCMRKVSTYNWIY